MVMPQSSTWCRSFDWRWYILRIMASWSALGWGVFANRLKVATTFIRTTKILRHCFLFGDAHSLVLTMLSITTFILAVDSVLIFGFPFISMCLRTTVCPARTTGKTSKISHGFQWFNCLLSVSAERASWWAACGKSSVLRCPFLNMRLCKWRSDPPCGFLLLTISWLLYTAFETFFPLWPFHTLKLVPFTVPAEPITNQVWPSRLLWCKSLFPVVACRLQFLDNQKAQLILLQPVAAGCRM